VVPLESSQLFRHLPPAELAGVSGVARRQSIPAGKMIFNEGDRGDGLYVVGSGQVEIFVSSGEHERHTVTHAGPGEFFGEMAVLDDQPRSAGAAAVQDTELWFLPRPELLALLEQSPRLGLTLLHEISSRLREFNRQYVREVLQAERLAVIGRFARSIIHDLKNPLNIIGLTAELTGMPEATPEMRAKSAKIIRRQVERISNLVGEILDFTQSSPTDLVLAPTSCSAFIMQLADDLGPELAARNVSLHLENQPPETRLLVDPRRLRRVFFNLAHNATDAMPEGGRVIWRFKLEPNEVVTEVEDTGPGFAPEIVGKLFQAFATHGKAHGTGLGLSICKRIITDHGGWIVARAEPGRGAIFAFGLPRREA
jgi:signal transduction histidine kinase